MSVNGNHNLMGITSARRPKPRLEDNFPNILLQKYPGFFVNSIAMYSNQVLTSVDEHQSLIGKVLIKA